MSQTGTIDPPRVAAATAAPPGEAMPLSVVNDAGFVMPPADDAPPPRALIPLPKRPLGSNMPAYAPNPILDAERPRTNGPAIFGLLVFLIFVVGGVAWAVFAPLAEAAIAPGMIKVEGTKRTIQHLEGGIVRELLVRDGSVVKANDVLVRLDVIQADSQMEATRAQRWALMAQDARLAAELAEARDIAFPAELLSADNPRALEAVTGQRALFEARRASLLSQTEVLRARIDQQKGAISGVEGQLRAGRQQLELIKQEEALRRNLVQQGLARLPDLLAVQRAMAQIEGNIQSNIGDLERARATIAESEKTIRQITDQRLQDASTELRDVRGKLSDSEEKLRAAGDVLTRREILAPEDGTIVNLKVFTIGAVIRPGEPIMDLVPARDRLIAEVNVQPTDIDVVYAGLQSEIRLPAFKQRLVPYLHGHVTWVAADVTTQEQTGRQFYRAYVEIDQDQLARLPSVFLTPGMPVEAHVQLGERSFWRYLTQPIRDSFTRAFREQ